MPPFPIRPFRIIERRTETAETYSLIVAPADGEPLFAFTAGQFVMVHLYADDGTVWAKAAYSMATAPVESKDRLELGIKIHGDFTKRAANLAVGDQLGIQGPYGAFTLKEDSDRIVFFAGGIGVTPLRSMIRDVLLNHKPIEMVLFYSDKTIADMAYEAEFRALAAAHPSFRFVPILTREQPAGWEGESSRINRSMIEKYVSDPSNARYYMCGPDTFMDAIKAILTEQGIDTAAKLRKESF